MFLDNILGGSSSDSHLPQNVEVKEPVLVAPLRICSNLFPPSNPVAKPPTSSCSAFQESQHSASLGSLGLASSSTLLPVESPYAQGPICPLGPVAFSTMPPAMPVESPYAPIQADQNSIFKSEMSTLDHHEYVEEYGEWDGEADIKDNLRLQCFQQNIEAKVKKECTNEMLKVSWFDDEVVMPIEDSLFLRCHQFLKDESKPDDDEEEDVEEEKECDLVKVSRRQGGRSSCRRQRREEVGRICLRRKEDGGFEIKKEVVEEQIPDADINHRHLVFGVDNCDVCPVCQV